MQRDPPVIRWLKSKEAAEYLHVSTATIWRMVRRMQADGRYKRGVIRYGSIIRINEKVLTEYALKEKP